MLTKKFITTMILFVALIVTGSNSFAQNLPGDKAGRVADMLYKKLNLTEDQYSKVYSSLLGYYTDQSSHMKEFKGDKSACNEACMKDWEKVKTSMSSVLDKDQMTNFSAISENKMMYNTMYHRKMTKGPKTETTSTTGTTNTTGTTGTTKTNTTSTPNTTTKTNTTTPNTKKGTDKK